MRLLTISIAISIFGCRSEDGIKKFNSTPDANITSHVSGDSETEGLMVSFMGTGSDSNHNTTELTATWYSGSDIICEATTLPTDGSTMCERVITIDDAEIILVIKDPEQASALFWSAEAAP